MRIPRQPVRRLTAVVAKESTAATSSLAHGHRSLVDVTTVLVRAMNCT